MNLSNYFITLDSLYFKHSLIVSTAIINIITADNFTTLILWRSRRY